MRLFVRRACSFISNNTYVNTATQQLVLTTFCPHHRACPPPPSCSVGQIVVGWSNIKLLWSECFCCILSNLVILYLTSITHHKTPSDLFKLTAFYLLLFFCRSLLLSPHWLQSPSSPHPWNFVCSSVALWAFLFSSLFVLASTHTPLVYFAALFFKSTLFHLQSCNQCHLLKTSPVGSGSSMKARGD